MSCSSFIVMGAVVAQYTQFGGVAQRLGRFSLAGGLSLICV